MTKPRPSKAAKAFGSACAAPKSKSKPFSIRLSDPERKKLEREAGAEALGPYMRSKLLGRSNNRQAIARILAALGSSDLAASMREIAQAAQAGALEDSDDLRLSLQAACLTIEKMRADLVRGLGLKVRD
ncbi:MAG: hypothetical protein AAGI28_02255 [Pseudomonadota bacterium]